MDLAFLNRAAVAARRAQTVDEILDAGRKGALAIVGSALLPQKCARALAAAGAGPRAFIEYDPRFWGRDVLGLPVLSPAEARAMLGEEALALSGVWSPHHRYAETAAWARAFGFSRTYPVAAAFWAVGESIGAHYQLGAPEIYADLRPRVEEVLAALADDESRRQLIGNLRWRVTLDPAHIPPADRRHVYFDPRLFKLPRDARILDVGAFDGDSLRAFLLWTGKAFARFYALEPDPASFARLQAYVASLPADVADKITPRRLAAGAAAGVISFATSGKPGSGGADSSGPRIETPCVRLADHFAGERIDYLKLDIEGVEAEALDGAWPLVRAHRPVVACAVYHNPEDLVSLPLAIMRETPDYAYYFRSHDDDGIDFVFYAVPRERTLGDRP